MTRGWRGVADAWRESPEWRKLFVARGASLLGSWLNTLALVELTVGGDDASAGNRGALALAMVFVLKQVPITILGPLAGVVADRFDRRKIFIICEVVAALVVCGFLLLEPGRNVGWVWTLTVLQVGVTAFFWPAFQALVPKTVADEHLTAANVANSALWSIMFAVGMAVGGVVLTEFGWRTAIVLDALSYAVSAAFVLAVRVDGRPPKRAQDRSRTRIAALLGIDEVRAGLRYVFGNRAVRRLVLIKFAWGAGFGAVTLILALLGRTTYRIGESDNAGVSYLWFCRALGTLFGPFLAYRFGGNEAPGLRKTITWGFWLSPIVYAAFALQHDFWLGGFLVFVAHLGGSTLWVISTVLLQKTVPDALRGRTFSADFGLVMLSSSASLLLAGSLIEFEWLAVADALLVCCGICLLAALWWTAGVRRDR